MSTEIRFEPDPSGDASRLPVAAAAGAAYGLLSGHGSPEGAVTGDFQGQIYTDLDNGAVWTFTGTPGTDTGWV